MHGGLTRSHKTCQFQWDIERFVPPQAFATGDSDAAPQSPTMSYREKVVRKQKQPTFELFNEHFIEYLRISLCFLCLCKKSILIKWKCSPFRSSTTAINSAACFN
jgi:hypothetical protein